MNKISSFTTPAAQSEKDFQNQPGTLKDTFELQWSDYVNGATQTAQVGNPWNALNDTPRSLYFNPLGMDIDETALQPSPISWNAFPNRINAYLRNQYQLVDRWKFADQGVADLLCPANPCDPQSKQVPFKPYGPRGWQDEYCEWAVQRSNDKITSVMFTCENPEYWFFLWNVSPDLVLELYQQTLGVSGIELADLYLLDSTGQAVIDPQTKRPAYNPINKWNSGTIAQYNSGGAMHLTSPPNSLGAEIYLAAAATIQRYHGPTHITVADKLICCSRYGQPNRNSDPHIGQSANLVVYNQGQQPNMITLLDPVGLYLQLPDASNFNAAFTLPSQAPQGKTAMDCWKIVRGVAQYPHYPNNAILHLVFEVPQEWGFTVSDITMNFTSEYGEPYNGPIQYGAQLVEFLQVQLAAVGLPATESLQNLPCVQPQTTAATLPSPSFLMDANLYQASVYNQLDKFANLTPQILTLQQGETRSNVALVASDADQTATVSFGEGITVVVDSFDDTTGVFLLTISVASTAPVGEKSVSISMPSKPGIQAPSYMKVVAATNSNA